MSTDAPRTTLFFRLALPLPGKGSAVLHLPWGITLEDWTYVDEVMRTYVAYRVRAESQVLKAIASLAVAIGGGRGDRR